MQNTDRAYERMAVRSAVWLLAAVLFQAGCSVGPPRTQLAAASSTDVLAAGAVYRPGSAPREFAGGESGRKPTRQRREHGPIGTDRRWSLTMSAPTRDGGWRVVRTVLFERAADGAVAMVEADDAKEKTITRFTPPLTMMPASLMAGRLFTAESAVEVVRKSDGVTIERGSAASGAELKGYEPGPPAVYEFVSTLTMQLTAALVKQVSVMKVGEAGGVRGEDETLNVTVGPLTVRSSHESWELDPQLPGDQ